MEVDFSILVEALRSVGFSHGSGPHVGLTRVAHGQLVGPTWETQVRKKREGRRILVRQHFDARAFYVANDLHSKGVCKYDLDFVNL